MNTSDSVNNQYVRRVKTEETLRRYAEKVNVEQNDSRLKAIERASKSLEHLDALQKEVDCKGYGLLIDTVSIGKRYLACFSAIEEYKSALFNIRAGGIEAVNNMVKKIEEAQYAFDHEKDGFYGKYNYQVNSVDALNGTISQCIGSAIASEDKEIEKLKIEAREISSREYSIDLKMSDPIQTSDKLPESIFVARYPVQKVSQAVLRDICINTTYQNIKADLRRQGNVIVNADFKHMKDEKIDAFVIAYILRFVETFPLGSVNVHIFDQNTNYLYKRLNNSFRSENESEAIKKIVQIHSSLSELSTFRDVICEDIFKKTSVRRPDLYSIYESDKTDPFNLIIIRDGLVNSSGYAPADVLDVVNSLTRPGDIGHKCGLRFLIIDNSSSFIKNLSASNKHLVDSIQDNCELKINYVEEEFVIADKKSEVLRIKENLDVYVQERSRVIADTIGRKEKSYIFLDDVSAKEVDRNPGNIMYIPVGMSGGKPVELPFSCRDEDGTVAGQCIGYMAIGQSGSGKSSFFHSVVLNGCMKYSPKDLQFWLLDFKSGGASSKYSRCGIPHIRIIAENNKIDDALCLFQMVLEEMERRIKAFNKVFTNDIVEYNSKAKADGLEYFPRIIIAIDEVQEIFREDNASVIQKLISSISTRMRSAGMHFVMVAQNLSEGKSYMLKDAFLPSATGRICFRVARDISRDSGFEEEFIERCREIAELKTGEAYVSYGKGSIKKVKMAYASPQDMSDKYFVGIRDRYPEYSEVRPLVIGSKRRLAITDSRQGVSGSYYDVLSGIRQENGICSAVIGEDVYRMSPLKISFSQHENSSMLFLGSDKRIASSLCASTAVSLMRQNVKTHLFNGDRTKIQEESETVPHPFMFICQKIIAQNQFIENHRLDQLKDVLGDLYGEYLKRQTEVQKADFEDPIFEPVFLMVNDLFGIESFISNDIIEKDDTETSAESVNDRGFNFDYDLFADNGSGADRGSRGFRENIQNIMSALLKNGYRYNMHVILAIKGDPSAWRSSRVVSEINNVVLFNDTEYADQIDNAYYLKEMLKNISNDGKDETMVVWSSKKTFSKIRPIIYRMSRQAERDALEKLV